MPYGQTFSAEDVPLIIHQTENGLGYCSSTEKLDRFEVIREHATWTKPSTNQAVNRAKVTPETLFKAHLRASVHDRSATMVRNMILNGEGLDPLEDLRTKLSLRRSPPLFVDYWKKGGEAEGRFLVNPAGTSATYYYIEGDEPMEWMLVPTNAR